MKLWGCQWQDYDGGGADGCLYFTKEEAEDRCKQLTKQDGWYAADGWDVRVFFVVERGKEDEIPEEEWET